MGPSLHHHSPVSNNNLIQPKLKSNHLWLHFSSSLLIWTKYMIYPFHLTLAATITPLTQSTKQSKGPDPSVHIITFGLVVESTYLLSQGWMGHQEAGCYDQASRGDYLGRFTSNLHFSIWFSITSERERGKWIRKTWTSHQFTQLTNLKKAKVRFILNVCWPIEIPRNDVIVVVVKGCDPAPPEPHTDSPRQHTTDID